MTNARKSVFLIVMKIRLVSIVFVLMKRWVVEATESSIQNMKHRIEIFQDISLNTPLPPSITFVPKFIRKIISFTHSDNSCYYHLV